MNKLVIANKGGSGQGKSSSIKKVAELLKEKYPNSFKYLEGGDSPWGDVKAIVTINGVKVGIESQGDPYSRIFVSIEDFLEKECDIMLLACRTRGETTQAVWALYEEEDYEIIWASNDRTTSGDEPTQKRLNNLYADRIVQLIEDRICGKI